MEEVISNDVATAKPVTAISRTAVRLSLMAAATFLVLLAALHFIKPEFDPLWRMISEYAIGDFGWVMMLAFLSLALSCATLFIAIRSQMTIAAMDGQPSLMNGAPVTGHKFDVALLFRLQANAALGLGAALVSLFLRSERAAQPAVVPAGD